MDEAIQNTDPSKCTFLGSIQHSEVPDVLRKGHFFLNCSLTDAFCVSIVEAASCGLYVISSDVGGVPEVLLEEHRTLCPPCAQELAQAVLEAIEKEPIMDAPHQKISEVLSWDKVSDQLIDLYSSATKKPKLIAESLFHSGLFSSLAAFIYYSLTLILITIF